MNTKKSISRYLKETVRQQRENPGMGLVQYQSLVSAHQYNLLLESTLQFLTKEMNILDWGCGNGHYSYFLCQNGFRTTMYSFDHQPPVLKNICPDSFQFIKGDPAEPRHIPFPDNHFDAVVSVGVLEHVREFEGEESASLKEISRILKKDGLFICSHIPNRYSWIEFFSRFFPKSHHHPHRYTRSNLKILLDSAGMEPAAIRKYGFLPRSSVNRIFPKTIANSATFTQLYGQIDRLMKFLFYPFLQNYLLIARKQ